MCSFMCHTNFKLLHLLDIELETGLFGGEDVHATKSSYFTANVSPR